MDTQWISRNKVVLVLVVVVGLFAVYAWKTGFTFNKAFQPAPAPKDTSRPPVTVPQPGPPVRTAEETAWRQQFENDRK